MNIIILMLATWRIAHMIASDERGPYNILGKFREFIGIRVDDLGQPYTTNELAEGLKCLWCNSVWFGALLAILNAFLPKKLVRILVLPFALSAAAILLNEAIEWLGQTPQRS